MSDTQTIDLRPAAVNFEAYQGDDFAQAVTVENEAGTGYALSTAKMQIRTVAGSLAHTLTVGSGITITNPGQIALSIPKATMAGLNATSYRYDIQATFTVSGVQRTILGGIFNVNPEITT